METELADLVHGVGHRLRRGYGERLGPLGLSPGQARALRVIVDSEPPLKMVQLAERLRIVPRSVTPVIDALEEAGLVRREVDPANRRSTLLVVTGEGRELYEQVREARRQVAEELFSVLTAEQRDQLRELLGAVDAQLA
ncbi:MarR family transcriptional regulator [Streptosporangium sp. NBC_01755]|uniref:MarR family winged helix-turn-helix transcriptional regulator n=1 Tax=unclassified Streptosporangium TaxID=2632669 RepID=UPI002DDC168A|nr:MULTISPECIES: MarR family transcriptional regulator [unclassified Streptosporangium]WSA27265.1 MarR family transcriptional regulator [Streptosporangium sp. NBC_01810]WSD01182.1 MarR family transcriptional regulator [Streptosporangium sp. NBC_01755]